MSGVRAAPQANPRVLRWARLLGGALVAALIGCLAHTTWFWVHTITFPYPLDYGEGPLLDQALRIGHGLGIYRVPGSEPPWLVGNYPPLYPLLNSLWVRLAGAAYWYGRVTSALGAVGAALFAGLIVQAITRVRLAAIVTGLLLLAIPYVGYWAGLGRIDTLALMLSLAGLWCVVRWPTSTIGLGSAVVLLTAAVYTRQTYLLAAPLASIVWIWSHSRRRALVFGGALATLGVLIGVAANLATAGAFWFDLVTANINDYSLENLSWYVVDLGKRVPILIIGLVAYAGIAVRDRPPSARLLVPYGLAALMVAGTAGKSGSSLNYLLELSTTMALAAGFLLAALESRPRRQLVALTALLVQATLLLVLPHPYFAITVGATDDLPSEERLASLVGEARGPVLADEDAGFLPLAGRPIELQPFELSQLSQAGHWDQSPLLAAIERHRYALILIYTVPDIPVEQYRWTPEMLAAIDHAYVVKDKVSRSYGTTLVYRPRA